MKDNLRPEDERQIARDIDKALHIPDEEPRGRIRPQAIARLLKEHGAQARPPAAVRPYKKWIAAGGSLAACAAVVLAIVLTDCVQSRRELSLAFMESEAGAAGSEKTESGTLEDTGGENAGDDAVHDGSLCAQASRATTANKATAYDKNAAGAPAKKPGASATTAWHVSAGSISALQKQGAVLLDVRSEAEFARWHPDGAVNLPYKTLHAEAVGAFNSDALLLVYGNTENADDAVLLLLSLGYRAESVNWLITATSVR